MEAGLSREKLEYIVKTGDIWKPGTQRGEMDPERFVEHFSHLSDFYGRNGREDLEEGFRGLAMTVEAVHEGRDVKAWKLPGERWIDTLQRMYVWTDDIWDAWSDKAYVGAVARLLYGQFQKEDK